MLYFAIPVVKNVIFVGLSCNYKAKITKKSEIVKNLGIFLLKKA